MKLPSLVRIPKHKKFEFVPRHYDAVEEELQQRIAKIKKEYQSENDSDSIYASGKIKFERPTKKTKFEFNIQVYLIVFMLLDLFLLFKADNISNVFWGLILIMQVTAIYLKIKLGNKKKL